MIFLHDMWDCPIDKILRKPDFLFRSYYEFGWLHAPFAEEAVRRIDNSVIKDDAIIVHRETGDHYAPQYLSGGTQALLLMYHIKDKACYSLCALGSNCSIWLPVACEGDIDIYGVLGYPMSIPEVRTPFKCYNDGSLITTPQEYATAYRKYAGSTLEDINWRPLIEKYGLREDLVEFGITVDNLNTKYDDYCRSQGTRGYDRM